MSCQTNLTIFIEINYGLNLSQFISQKNNFKYLNRNINKNKVEIDAKLMKAWENVKRKYREMHHTDENTEN